MIGRAITALTRSPARTESRAVATAARYCSIGTAGSIVKLAAVGVGGAVDSSEPSQAIASASSRWACVRSDPTTVIVVGLTPDLRTTTSGTSRSHAAPGRNGTTPMAIGPCDSTVESCSQSASPSDAASAAMRAAVPRPATPTPSRTNSVPSPRAMSFRSSLVTVAASSTSSTLRVIAYMSVSGGKPSVWRRGVG